MAGFTICMTAKKEHSFSAIHQQIHQIVDFEQVCRLERRHEDTAVLLLVYEKYFLRTNSYAAVTIFLTEQGGRQTVDLISTGGGNSLSNVSLGANRKIAMECANALEALGFAVDSEHSDQLPGNRLKHFFQ